MTLDGQLVAVPIAIRKDGLAVQPGPAVALFETKVGSVRTSLGTITSSR
jgi:hypothetical protein